MGVCATAVNTQADANAQKKKKNISQVSGIHLRKVLADLVFVMPVNDFLHIFLYHIHAHTREALILKPMSCIEECVCNNSTGTLHLQGQMSIT